MFGLYFVHVASIGEGGGEVKKKVEKSAVFISRGKMGRKENRELKTKKI